MSAVGEAYGARATAAALACHLAGEVGGALLIDFGGPQPRPTLLSLSVARALEEKVAATLPDARVAARGKLCQLVLEAGPEGLAVAIAFEMGDEFASRVVETARYGTVIYAAVRSREGDQVFGLVLLAERCRGMLYTKAVREDMGPAEDWCPKRILDLLSEPSNDHARDWRGRCRARLERGHPSPGQVVIFARPLKFFDGTKHARLTFVGGSRYRSDDGAFYRIASLRTFDFELGDRLDEEPAADRRSAVAAGERK